jgi:hypothetical protein
MFGVIGLDEHVGVLLKQILVGLSVSIPKDQRLDTSQGKYKGTSVPL